VTDDFDGTVYRTSSFSGGGNCVQAGQLKNGDIRVRDSRNPSAVVTISAVDWNAFIAGVKNDEFDFATHVPDEVERLGLRQVQGWVGPT
jgi:uncharacterized protein DUF397